jgi:hypothetical protein
VKRLILPIIVGLLATGSASAEQASFIRKIDLPIGKNLEGITVNPVTHKAYVIGELATEGADDYKAVFVISNEVLAGKSGVKVIHIPNESEYAAVDPVRNLIYVPTKYSVEGVESDDDVANEGEVGEVDTGVDPPDPPVAGEPAVVLGTLTVIDGKTDTVLAIYPFDDGIQPEGAAVDPATGIVYVAAKAPEGESSIDDVCNPWATPIPDVAEPGDVECWTSGHIYAFSVNASQKTITLLKDIPAGDDPESVAFANGMVYAANEDDGTVTIASAVKPDGTGGALLTDRPVPPTQPYALGVAPYSLGVFYGYGPDPLACTENQFETDKMAAGAGSVFITDDRSRVAKITGTAVVAMRDVPGATACQNIPNSDGGGNNSANNITFMQSGRDPLSGATYPATIYAVSEQNTVTLLNASDLAVRAVITVPGAIHLDGIGVDPAANRIWLTDEDQQAVFLLTGPCANGTGRCR